jgi:hypothetical protein
MLKSAFSVTPHAQNVMMIWTQLAQLALPVSILLEVHAYQAVPMAISH